MFLWSLVWFKSWFCWVVSQLIWDTYVLSSWADRKLSCQVLVQQGGRVCICSGWSSMYQMFVSLYPYESSKVVIRLQFSSVLCPCLGTYPKVHLVAKFLYEDVSWFFCYYLFCLSPWKGCLSFFFFLHLSVFAILSSFKYSLCCYVMLKTFSSDQDFSWSCAAWLTIFLFCG